MSTLITADVWMRITAEASISTSPAFSASAYFGPNADKLLPLPPESMLVVDASIPTVQSGSTCPISLLRMKNKGVRIFSSQYLHAKLYAFDKSAFVGSCNASSRSANLLIEAAVLLKRVSDIQEVRNFVKSICVTELFESDLNYLGSLYTPPEIPKIPLQQSYFSTLVMELLQEQGGSRATQVQPPRAVWENYLGVDWLSPPFPILTLTNEATGITVQRHIVEHDHNMTIEIAGAELPRPAILQLRRIEEHNYSYKVHRPGTNNFSVLQGLLNNIQNPLRTHGRDWLLI